jgi:hypothetical protein
MVAGGATASRPVSARTKRLGPKLALFTEVCSAHDHIGLPSAGEEQQAGLANRARRYRRPELRLGGIGFDLGDRNFASGN